MTANRVPASADFYEELQVSPNAEPEIIEAAYRRLARKYHPDVSTDPASTARIRRIVRAYAVLSDPRQRAAYDASLARGGPLRETGEAPGAGRKTHLRVWLGAALIFLLLLFLAVPILRTVVLRGAVFILVALVLVAVGWYTWRMFK